MGWLTPLEYSQRIPSMVCSRVAFWAMPPVESFFRRSIEVVGPLI